MYESDGTILGVNSVFAHNNLPTCCGKRGSFSVLKHFPNEHRI
jgi:hypothetical protein